MLWNRSLVMYDAETNSYWSHILGQAMQGELKDTKLEMLPSEMTTWSEWLSKHPGTTVLNLSRTSKGYTKEVYQHPENFVYGWSVSFQRYHSRLDVLVKYPVLNVSINKQPLLITYDPGSTLAQIFSRTLDGRELSFVAAEPSKMRDNETGSIWDLTTGQAISGKRKGKRLERRLGMLSYRRAWETFYPGSKEISDANSTALSTPPGALNR